MKLTLMTSILLMTASLALAAGYREDCTVYERAKNNAEFQKCIARNSQRTEDDAREWARRNPGGKTDCRKVHCTAGRAD